MERALIKPRLLTGIGAVGHLTGLKPSQFEKIGDRCMGSTESSGLSNGFEPTH